MNEDEMQDRDPLAGETLERTLARYARVRLDVSPAQARRARSAVMEEAWRRRFELAAGVAAARDEAPAVPRPTARPRRQRLPFAGWGVRRLSGALSAAVLAGLLLGTTAFGVSRAGGPLYEARLALEDATLPSDPASRVEAEIAMAQSRLAEIVEASSRGDETALTAALGAYERTIAALGETSGEGAARAMEAVASHRAVLERVAGTAPAQARQGLEHALSASGKVIDRLSAGGAGAPSSGGAKPGAGGGNSSSNSNGGQGGQGGLGGQGGNGNGPGVGPTAKPGRSQPPKPTNAPEDPGKRGGSDSEVTEKP